MSQCSNCGAELDAGAKFCMECGTPVPQVKKCTQCGMELPLKARFCFGCGASQDGSAAPAAGVNMGDKNVVAGDVIGQKISGDNVQSKVMGNVINNTFQDETKKVVYCHVCGKHLTNDSGHTCPGCGNVVCEDHFDAKLNMCLRCAADIKEQNASKYKEALQEVLADGVVDFNERAMLKKLQVQLGISDKDAELWEQAAKASRVQSADKFTTIENINLKKAEDLFYEKGEIEKAYQLVEPIYKSHPINETLLNIYLPIVVQHDINIAKQTIQSIKVDCLALCIAEIEVALQENRLDIVERKLQQGKTLWPDNGMLKYYEALFYIRLAFESGEWSYIQEAKKITDSFAETNDKIERTLRTKMQKRLASLNGEQVDEAIDNQQDLYKALYLRGIGIPKISVGPERKVRSIQQAIDLIDVNGVVNVDAGLYKEQLVFSKSFKLVGTQGSILNKSSKSLPIIVLDADKTCKLSKAVEIEGVVFTHNADLSFSNLNDYAHSEKEFEEDHEYSDYGEEGWNTLLLVESDSVLSNVGILDSENYGITFSKNSAKLMDSVVSRCYDNCIDCVDSSSAEISKSIISHSSNPGIFAEKNSKPTITGCEIFGHSSNGICEDGYASGTYSDCDIHSNSEEAVCIADSASGIFKNCHVHDNMDNGFYIIGEATPKIENCKIHDNKLEMEGEGAAPGVVVKENSKPTFTGCEIYGHLAFGIWEEDNACGTYSDCDIHSNSSGGVDIQDSASGTFKNCRIHDNECNGFNTSGESTPKIENCKIHNNKTEGENYPGVVVDEDSKPTFTGCEIFDHLSYGIWEKGNACGTYSDCDIHNNGNNGINIQDSASGSYNACRIHDNEGNGFNTSGESIPKMKNCKIHDNKKEGSKYPGVVVKENSKPTFTGCEIYEHLSNGIWEKDNACGTYSDCDIHSNSSEGVDIQDSVSGTFKNCRIHDNMQIGFIIKGESTPKIENCKIHDNKTEGSNYTGVVARDNAKPTITGCEIYGHFASGIVTKGESAPKIEGCKIHDNKAEGKHYPGVVVSENSKPTITGCEIYGHLSNGIWEKDNACGTYVSCNIHDNTGKNICIDS